MDGDVPKGLIECDSPDASDGEVVEEKEWGIISGSVGNAEKRKSEESMGGKRKKLWSLPTLASHEDYVRQVD